MPAENVIERAFSGGEIAPGLYARTDISKYQTGLRTLRNQICMRLGGAVQRPGSMYVATTFYVGSSVRLIPFVYDETGLGQSYVLEFGNQYIGFYQNGATVVSAPNTPYRISSPYLQADLQTLQFSQSADVITITHQNYPPMELTRDGPINWVLSTIVFAPQISAPTGVVYTPNPGSGEVQQNYAVVAVSSTGEESLASGFGAITIPGTPTVPIVISWNPVSGAVSYKIYASVGALSNYDSTGFIGTSLSTTFSDTGIVPDYTNGPPIPPVGLFSGAGNYPATVGFVQQRRCFGNTINNPVGFWMSQTGYFYNFNTHITSLDSDAIYGSIAGEEVNAVEHLVELKFMLMLTAGAEIYVQGNGTGVVTPSAINAATQSQYGASPLRPLKVGDVMIFNQSLGSFIRDFVFDFVIDGYRGNDITVFSAHLFEGYQIDDWAFQKVPDSIIWAVRSDGILLSCTYVREQQILAWAHHDFNGGFVENVCAIPENGEYAVYVSVRRVINGTTLRYIERLSSRIWQGPAAAVAAGTANALNDPIDATNLDCYTQFDGRNTGSTTMTLMGAIVIKSGVNDGISFSIGVTNYFVTVPAGEYSLEALSTAVGVAMNGAIADNFIGQPFAGKFKLSNSVASLFTLKFNVGDPNYARSIGVTLGFPPGDYTSSFFAVFAPNYPVGYFSSIQTAYQQQLTIVASQIAFGSNGIQIGDAIFLEDAEWVSSQGVYGNQLRCIVQDFSDAYSATVTPDKIVPLEFQNLPISIWARAVSTVSGLTYLVGQTVSIWADRYVVGSPLNKKYEIVYTVPNSGILTLDRQYSVIYIGLPMTADFETLQIDTSFGDSIQGERKAISRVTVYLYKARGLFGGTQNPDYDPDNLVNGVVQDPLFNLIEEKQQGDRQTYDAPPSLMTEWQSTNITVNWSKEGRVFIRNVDPIPFGILSVIPAGLTSAKVAWSQRV